MSRLPYCLIFLMFLSSHQSLLCVSEDQYGKRVHANIVIGDYQTGCQEALIGLQQYPDSKLLWQAYLRSLAKTGDEKKLMSQWRSFIAKFPEEKENRDILECLAWAVLENGYSSASPLIRVTSLLGAFFSQDAKGVALLLKGLRDEHAYLRAAAIKLSSMLYDVALQDEILSLLRSEKVWKVRLEAIKALGKLQMSTARRDLISIVANDNVHIEEKTAAIAAIVSMSEKIDKKNIVSLVKSDHVGMRLMACEFIMHYEQTHDVDLLYPLIADYHADVRAKVFQTLGYLRVQNVAGHPVEELAAKGASDPDPLVAVTAAWVLVVNNPQRGQRVFAELLNRKVPLLPHLAAAALASSGKYGLPLAVEAFKEQSDPYIKMNLALGLIGQRKNVESASKCLFEGLSIQKEQWELKDNGHFKILAPSEVKHNDDIPNYPEAINQLTRLEILQLLAIVQYPKAQQAIKTFLQESNWGITGMAAALLLTEGDDEAVDIVKTLLKDSEYKVKVQAALILALWGRGEDTVQLLQEAYSTADRELKGQILEGIGRVGSATSLAFLAERLQEPFQTLRIVAAAALLECLYH